MSEVYDVVIVGTGAGGSTMAMALTSRGLKVLSLEYGPDVRPSQLMSIEMFNQAFRRVPYPELKPWLSGRPEPNWNNGKYFVTKQESNFTTVGEDWRWRRYRLLGGRTKFWNCVSPRFSPRDFTAALEDGYGEPWPITYKDIEPYYDRIETMAGFCGGDVDHPECPKGKYMPAARFAVASALHSKPSNEPAIRRWPICRAPWRSLPGSSTDAHRVTIAAIASTDALAHRSSMARRYFCRWPRRPSGSRCALIRWWRKYSSIRTRARPAASAILTARRSRMAKRSAKWLCCRRRPSKPRGFC